MNSKGDWPGTQSLDKTKKGVLTSWAVGVNQSFIVNSSPYAGKTAEVCRQVSATRLSHPESPSSKLKACDEVSLSGLWGARSCHGYSVWKTLPEP